MVVGECVRRILAVVIAVRLEISTDTTIQEFEITLAADAIVPFKTVNTQRLVANQ